MSLGVDGAVGTVPVELLRGLLADRCAGPPGSGAMLVEAGGQLHVEGLGFGATDADPHSAGWR